VNDNLDDDGYPEDDLHRRHSDGFRGFSTPLVGEFSAWEPTSLFDRSVVGVSSFVSDVGVVSALVSLVVAAVLAAVVSLGVAVSPLTSVFTVASVVLAVVGVGYLRDTDPVRDNDSVALLVTFLLGGLALSAVLSVNAVLGSFGSASAVALVFYVAVAPLAESLKLLAVRLHPYTTGALGTAVHGAVYGAFVGLGFAAFGNLLYLTTNLPVAFGGTVGRAGVAPGHVLWSAVAGYYLGLAKENPRHAGVIALKGLVAASLLHATYNTVTYGAETVVGVPVPIFVVVFHALTAYYLVSKVERRRNAYPSVAPRK
jgi:RsiW-degrading membrane proteinase PrsW (M82 family)